MDALDYFRSFSRPSKYKMEYLMMCLWSKLKTILFLRWFSFTMDGMTSVARTPWIAYLVLNTVFWNLIVIQPFSNLFIYLLIEALFKICYTSQISLHLWKYKKLYICYSSTRIFTTCFAQLKCDLRDIIIICYLSWSEALEKLLFPILRCT